MNKIYTLARIIIFLLVPIFICAQANPPIYHKVKLLFEADHNHDQDSHEHGLHHKLNDIGIFLDHSHDIEADGEIFVFSDQELTLIKEANIPHQILIENLAQQIEARNIRDQESLLINAARASNGFEFGSMGGFYTWSEVIERLDFMRTNYPNLASAKFSIGQSHEGRDIWAVKISDNPDTDESANETAVYYDALHHAREPLSMSTALNYMFWLLENYGTDPEATYLIDNREMYFVPVVNPDGYVYNETTNPNGGGLWRKNRRDVDSSSCIGVDLNRNYSFGYGLNSGSSSNPCNDTYRGESAFSEPESQAVRDFVNNIDPPIAFSIHSTAGKYLQAYGYTLDPVDYEAYTDFSLDMLEDNEYPYGVTGNMLGYTSSGTTRDYLYGNKGIYAWTPEIGGSGFWPAMNEIMPRVEENEKPLRYIAWVAGAYPDIKNLVLVNDIDLIGGATAFLNVEIYNKGLRQSATNVRVILNPITSNISMVNDTVAVPTIAARAIGDIAANPLTFTINNGVIGGEEIQLEVIVEIDGVRLTSEIITFYAGDKTNLINENAESGLSIFAPSGNGNQWDTTFVDARSGSASFADSRYTNSANNTDNYLSTNSNIDLTGTLKPILSFHAKWSVYAPGDYVILQISNNNGSSWSNLKSYQDNQTWIQEIIDLSAYVDDQIRLRFYLHTDGNTPSDGFYFDDFRVDDYAIPPPPPDADNDGVTDSLDLCNGYDDVDMNNDGTLDACDPCPVIDFVAQPIIPHDSGQDAGNVTTSNNGTALIENNAWKAVEVNYTITASTVLEFDFKSTLEGEIHFIGFDDDLSLGSDPQFKMYGFQNTGTAYNEDYEYTAIGQFQHFTIPVGNIYTGLRRYLVLVADNDSGAEDGNSFFRNIKIYEDLDGDLACDICNETGDPCDDGSVCTVNDSIDTNCNCVGEVIDDLDSDGFCSVEDPDDNDPCNPDNTVGACDTDNDGTPDGLDCAPNDNTAAIIDSCGVCGGQGLTCSDIDLDGVFADVDPDDNDPCNPDNTIGACDTDNDGTPDGLDCAPNDNTAAIIDSCGVCGGQGLTCSDIDMDGAFANVDPDDNDPCVPDNTNGLCDTDNDGTPDGLDCAPNDPSIALLDSCNVCGGDGLSCQDLDGDGVFADVDPDDNDPCNPDNAVGACDTDNDGTPDGLDCAPNDNTAAIIDSCGVCGGQGLTCSDIDMDGVFADVDPDDNDPCNPDNTIGACDTDNDGTPDGLDCAPNDNTAAIIDSCGVCGGQGLTCSDIDMDGVFADVDPDDNDPCVPDNTIGLCDTDGDGTPDGLDCAPNDPAIAILDSCNVCGGDGLSCQDLDGDGVFADIDPDDNDPCNPDNAVGACDTDNDGTPDGLDCAPNDPAIALLDACNVCGGDGTTCTDVDGDGVFADVDPDDNDPCNPDNTVGACDTDNDGTPDGLDCAPNDNTAAIIDSCGVCGGQGLTCSDIDMDGVFANVDPDDNDPCVPDNTNGVCDTDNDGTPDGLDCAPNDPAIAILDSCNVCGGDGLSCQDLDGDGVFADVDPDDNDPCNPDNAVGACDTDNDGTPDGLDCAPNDSTIAILDACNVCGGDGTTCTDVDGDGVFADVDPDDNDPCNPDNTVGACDTDNDGTPDGLDCAPNDNTAAIIDSCGVCGGQGLTCSDLDMDGVFANIDPDDNDPCVPDNTIGLCDTDGDGTPDGLDCNPTDPNATFLDSCGVCAGNGLSCKDFDADGVFADVDPDDNDPCAPNNTNSLCDTDSDGVPDGLDQCPGIDDALIGQSCDDGDSLTINDVYTTNCICEGAIPASLVFYLIDADADTVIRILNDGDTINLDVDGIDLNIEAVINTATGSVGFEYDGDADYSVENFLPFALEGDNNGNYNSWTPTLGLHELSANAYNGNDLTGGLIISETINFVVVDFICFTIGDVCDDGDPCTINDTINVDCDCLGTLTADNDGDGLCEVEDPDDNDPCNPDNTIGACDSDNDGTPDGLDCAPTDPNAAKLDACNVCGGDGTSCTDLDADGYFADVDPDDNNPCVPDNTVGTCDTDGDGTPDGLDPCPDDPSPDSDGDGICDSQDICQGSDDTIDTNGDGIPDGCANCPLINFNSTPLVSYTGQDNGTVAYSQDGSTFLLEGNSWKALEINYEITENTILEFDFGSTEEGELHEVFFDNNLTLNANPRFKLFGTQTGNSLITDFTYTDLGLWTSFKISLGDYVTGLKAYVGFSMDNDANPNTGNSYFRNVKIYEDEDGDGECDLICVTLDCQDDDNDGVFADVDPDDNDPCVPDTSAGLCCQLMVMNNQELGIGSFLDVIDCAQSGDTITFDPSVNNSIISFAVQNAIIAKDLYIIANPSSNITIFGNTMSQTFFIKSGFNVRIEGLKILSGNGILGRAIENEGTLTLKNCDVIDSQSGNLEHLIFNKGNLKIEGVVNLLNL